MKVRVCHEGAGLLLHRVAFVGVCFGCIGVRNTAVGPSPCSPSPAPALPRLAPGLGWGPEKEMLSLLGDSSLLG